MSAIRRVTLRLRVATHGKGVFLTDPGQPMPYPQVTRLRLRRAPQALCTPRVLAGETLVVLCGTNAVLLLLPHSPQGGNAAVLFDEVRPSLAAVTAGLAAVAALLCALAARLRPEVAIGSAGYAWGFYALVVMPVSVAAVAPDGAPAGAATATAASAIFGVLLALGLVEIRPRWLSGPWAPAAGTVLTVLFAVAAAMSPSGVAVTFASPVAAAVPLAGWGLLGGAYIAHGLRTRAAVWHRMGLALLLVAAGHAFLVAGGAVLGFGTLRLLGMLVLLAALLLHTRRLVAERRVAEATRRHEIRNSLATLSSVTTLMTPHPGVELATDHGYLSTMIDDEFARLHGLLEDSTPSSEPHTVVVDVVLTRLVTLRRAAGQEITVDCPPGMVVRLPGETLAQVVTNLLANCARHAPGAAVHVATYRAKHCCVIEVSDAGPGTDSTVPTAGDGIGLAHSARLVAAAGGALELRPTTRFVTGTTALLRLPRGNSSSHPVAAPTEGRTVS